MIEYSCRDSAINFGRIFKMSTVNIDFSQALGKMKIMHAVNNGPVVAGKDQTRGNQDDYRAARIPLARTHDASFYSGYGGEHTVDIHAIFRDFDADVNNPASYDFACTDNYMKQIITYGAMPFYRLGSRIEHEVKKYGTIPPKDFKKWAQICEHIIAHYNEGWADGFEYGIEYWEIWNEPDLDTDDSTNKRCWGGTEAEFAELYVIASKHLKARFPHLKIGGPASAGDEAWMKRFLDRVAPQGAPIDFFSWHWYWTEPTDMSIKASRIRKLIDEAGYENAESILNEWNYVRCWTTQFVYTIKQIISMKGAAFFSACMCAGQNNPDLDMMMYYDARPGAFNGLFDYYTMEPLKGYYPFYIFSNLYELGTHTLSESDDECVYAVCSSDGEKHRAMVTYYSEKDDDGPKFVRISIKGADTSRARVFVINDTYTMTERPYKFENDTLEIRLERNTILYFEF